MKDNANVSAPKKIHATGLLSGTKRHVNVNAYILVNWILLLANVHAVTNALNLGLWIQKLVNVNVYHLTFGTHSPDHAKPSVVENAFGHQYLIMKNVNANVENLMCWTQLLESVR